MRFKWDHQCRVFVCQRVYEEFGPFREWDAKWYPRGKRQQYQIFLQSVALELEVIKGLRPTVGAIDQQIRFGITAQKFADTSRIRNVLLNKSAALESRLIGYKDLAA